MKKKKMKDIHEKILKAKKEEKKTRLEKRKKRR